MIPNMPLWLALLDDDDWEQLRTLPENEDPRSWTARAVDEIIAEEEEDDDSIPDWPDPDPL